MIIRRQVQTYNSDNKWKELRSWGMETTLIFVKLCWSFCWCSKIYPFLSLAIIYHIRRNLDTGGFFFFENLPNVKIWCMLVFSHVWLFVTLWTVACQAPLSMGFFQARILEWVASSSSRGSSQSRDQTHGLLYLLHWPAGSLPLSHLGSSRFDI